MATYLVTGGCGFIGSHLVDELINQKHTVKVLDNLSTGTLENLNSKAIFIEGDICDEFLVQRVMSTCDGCFHLAAVASVDQSVKDLVGTNHTNLVGTLTLLKVASYINKEYRPFKFVYASSAAVYGDSPNPPFKETDVLSPISPYGADKESCELQARVAGRIHQLPNAGLRFFNVYGERQNPSSSYSGVISIFLNQLKQGQPITIFGDGEQTRDFIYVKDIVHYLCKAMGYANTDSLVFNACNGIDTSITQLAEILIDILGEHPQIIHAKAHPGDIRTSIGDNTLAKTRLGITKSTSLREGLTHLCEGLGLQVERQTATVLRFAS
jgi:UDP-glucose 4-epimerase